MDQSALVNPISQVVYIGDPVYISCTSSTPVKWTKSGLELPHSNTFKSDLWLQNVTEKDSGKYVCHGNVLHDSEMVPFQSVSEVLVGGRYN